MLIDDRNIDNFHQEIKTQDALFCLKCNKKLFNISSEWENSSK